MIGRCRGEQLQLICGPSTLAVTGENGQREGGAGDAGGQQLCRGERKGIENGKRPGTGRKGLRKGDFQPCTLAMSGDD